MRQCYSGSVVLIGVTEGSVEIAVYSYCVKFFFAVLQCQVVGCYQKKNTSQRFRELKRIRPDRKQVKNGVIVFLVVVI